MPTLRVRADTKKLLDDRFNPKTHTYDEAIKLLFNEVNSLFFFMALSIILGAALLTTAWAHFIL